MKNLNRRLKVHLALLLTFLLVFVWQIIEHNRVKAKARATLLERARDISASVSVAIRSMSRFGIIQQDRLETALGELAKSGELKSVALLNNSGNIFISAGEPVKLPAEGFPRKKAVWEGNAVMITNIVDLGVSFRDRTTSYTAPIIMRRAERQPAPPHDFPSSRTVMQGSPSRRRPERDGNDEHDRRRERPFRRPPWLSEKQFRELQDKQGLHGFVLVIRTDAFAAEVSRDFWLRVAILAITIVAILGMAAAWKTFEKSERLRISLVQARELNKHLKELNVASAGLSHETRNPLNLVRGQAQIISSYPAVPPKIRAQTLSIVDEVDRITNRLSEFINYSKPAVPRPVPVNLAIAVKDVRQTLAADIQEKSIKFESSCPELTIEADEGLLRQVIFNLTLNAIQAVDDGGEIEIAVQTTGGATRRGAEGEAAEASLTIRDNGCGIEPENNENIYRPYYTTRKTGTGLGLAVVLRIVQAHGWRIEHRPAGIKGTVFTLSKLKVIRAAN